MSGRDLDDALRAGAEKVAQGRIRVDAERAQQRLRDFRFADPAHWVLEVLRAAVLSDARRVAVRCDADDVEVTFDGEPLAPEMLNHLAEHALSPGTTRDEKRARLLALGVAGALGVGARFVTVRSGSRQVRFTGERFEASDVAGKGTHLHLRKAFGWRVASAFVKGSPEAAAIRERARRFPIALTLNDTRVPDARPMPAGLASRSVQGNGWRLEVVLPNGEPLPRSTLDVDVAGVLVTQRTPELPGLQVRAWLRGDDLRRNASGSDVVDGEPAFEVALEALRNVSRDLFRERLATLQDDDTVWRRFFVERLLELTATTKDGPAADVLTFAPRGRKGRRAGSKEEPLHVEALLRAAKLVPGPGGEWYSMDEVHATAGREGRLLFSYHRHPRGSYPEPAVYLPPGSQWTRLMPRVKHVDVATIVAQRRRIAERRRAWELEPEEEPRLAGDFVVRGPVEDEVVRGELGFGRQGHGAFVRMLHRGRFLEAGELATLAPLQLRAVIDWQPPLADAYFDPESPGKALARVAERVERAATAALLAEVGRLEAGQRPPPELRPHLDALLARLVLGRQLGLVELPEPLRRAELFECLDGSAVSLDALAPEPTWQFLTGPSSVGLLDGSRVLHLTLQQAEVLQRLGGERAENVGRRLQLEAGVRKRLAAPRVQPALRDAVLSVRVDAGDVTGLVGIPREAGSKLELSLLREGFAIETTELSARYQLAVASLECPALTPTPNWLGVVRDDAWERVVRAAREAERRLALELAQHPAAVDHPGARRFFLAFLSKELTPLAPDTLDEVQRAVFEALLLRSAHGPISLARLHALVQSGAPLLWLPPEERREVPEQLVVVVEPPQTLKVLTEMLEARATHARDQLEAFAALRRVDLLPRAELKLSPDTTLEVRVQRPGSAAIAGLRRELVPRALVAVTTRGRLVTREELPCGLPLEVVVDCEGLLPLPDRSLSGPQRDDVQQTVLEAMRAVLVRALETPEVPDSVRALRLGVGRHLDAAMLEQHATEMRSLPLFPCTDGVVRSVAQLDEAGVVRFVTRPMRGTLPDGLPIVVADERTVEAALGRWPRMESVDAALQAQLEAVAARAAMEAVSEVRCEVASPWRQPVDSPVATGEVVVSAESAGRLWLYLERKPLVMLTGALPGPFAAAVDAKGITPRPGFSGVEDNDAFRAVVDAVVAAAAELSRAVAERPLDEGDEAARVQLAFWAAGLDAWRWGGKKKQARGKRKEATTEEPSHPLARLPLLRTVRGETMSLARLTSQKVAEYARKRGGFVEADRDAWWPRPGELELAQALDLALRDVTDDVDFEQSLRAQPRRAPQLQVPRRWTEVLADAQLRGEVALRDAPGGELVIELLHEGLLLETLKRESDFGGVAVVECPGVTPVKRFSAAKRDAAFRLVLSRVEAALERLVARRLSERDSGWRAWALAAAERRSGHAGPVGALVSGLELFEDVSGTPFTVGALLAHVQKTKVVPVAARGLEPADPGQFVLAKRAGDEELIKRLGGVVEDVSSELLKQRDLRRAMQARRLSTLSWKGDALLRLAASAPFTGELALAWGVTSGITLARDGVAVASHDERWPGVVGVLDVPGLAVNDAWTEAELTRAQREALRRQVDALFEALAAAAPTLPVEARAKAAVLALGYLGELGVDSPGHLAGLKGGGLALARAALFETVRGERVSLAAVADAVNSGGRVAVMERRLVPPDVGAALVLVVDRWDSPWLAALEARLGSSRVWRVSDLGAWQQALAEAEPRDGTPEALGLRLLRRELRLLRAGALGTLTPDDLEDVRLHRAGGKAPLRYDRKRKLVLLDPEAPLIGRALAEARSRPERLWVLLAAVFGVVNRELRHVTDPDEVKLLLALSGHLAANPKLLAASD